MPDPRMRLVCEVRIGDPGNASERKVHGLGRPPTIDRAIEEAKLWIERIRGGRKNVVISGAIIEELVGTEWVPASNVCG